MTENKKKAAALPAVATDARKRRANEIYAAHNAGATFEELGARFEIRRAMAWQDYQLALAERGGTADSALSKRVNENLLEEFIAAHHADFVDAKRGIGKNKELVMRAIDMLTRMRGQYPAGGDGVTPIQIAIVGGGQVASNRPIVVKGRAVAKRD